MPFYFAHSNFMKIRNLNMGGQIIIMCLCVLSHFSYVWLFPALWPVWFLSPWDSLGKNTGVDCHALLQGIFPIQGLNLLLLNFLHWQAGSLPLVPPSSYATYKLWCLFLEIWMIQLHIVQEDLFHAENSSVQFSHSVMSDSLWPHGGRTPGFPVHHQLPELAQTHVHWVCDAIQPSHLLSSPAFNLSQHQGLFQWVSSSHQIAKVSEFQPQHQSFQWIFRTDFL